MLVQPQLLKVAALWVSSKVFVCGPGYASSSVDIRHLARKALEQVPNVRAIYGEEIEKLTLFRRQGTDLQTLEAKFAHDVDFTLLILESPGSIAELGTFSQLPGLRGRLIVLVSSTFFRAESYIARGPLSLLVSNNPNSVIYFDTNKPNEMISRILYPLTFYKYAHFLRKYEYLRNTRLSYGISEIPYDEYIVELRNKYNQAVTLIAIISGDAPNYAELLLLSGLAPKQLNASLHSLYNTGKVEKIGSGSYRAVHGYGDDLLEPFNTTAISRARAALVAAA